MQYTSGTTGFPKGVMLTHHNILNNGFYIGERQKFTRGGPGVPARAAFPLLRLVLGIMAIVTHGATAVIVESFDPLLVLASVQKEKCTALYGVPTMFIAELAHPMFPMFDLSSLRTGIMAGSPCPIEIMKRVIAEMHASEITIAYGLTEGSPVMTQTSTDDPIELRVSTVGQHLPGIEVRIVDPRQTPRCRAATQGEVVCRGYNVMKGYYNMPEATAAAIDSEGWLHSGDLGTMDDERLLQDHRQDQGHDHPRRGEHVSPRDRGVPPHDARREGRPGGRGRQPEVRRRGGRVRHPQGRRPASRKKTSGTSAAERSRVSRCRSTSSSWTPTR